MATRTDERTEEQRRMDEDCLARVQRGIALLEEKLGPEWWKEGEEVWKTHGFDIGSGSCCVVGGIYGDGERCSAFSTGISRLGIGHNSAAHGFNIMRTTEEWDVLQSEWLHQLKARGLEIEDNRDLAHS